MNKIEVLIFSTSPVILSIYLDVILIWCIYGIHEIAGIITGVILLGAKIVLIVWLWQGYNILKGGKND